MSTPLIKKKRLLQFTGQDIEKMFIESRPMKEKSSTYPENALSESMLKNVIFYVEYHRPDIADKLKDILKGKPLLKNSKKISEK